MGNIKEEPEAWLCLASFLDPMGIMRLLYRNRPAI
jgi:hypothetical protein